MYDLEQFCKSLYGLTPGQAKARIESKGDELERMERTARNKRKRRTPAGQVPPPNYRPAIEQIGRLAHYVIYGGVPTGLTAEEAKLFSEVVKNLKQPKPKSN
jgi:hypothetical protein